MGLSPSFKRPPGRSTSCWKRRAFSQHEGVFSDWCAAMRTSEALLGGPALPTRFSSDDLKRTSGVDVYTSCSIFPHTKCRRLHLGRVRAHVLECTARTWTAPFPTGSAEASD